MNYIIKYELSDQVSQYDFRMIWREKIVDENTTIGDIVKWFEQKEKDRGLLPSFFPEMQLTRPDINIPQKSKPDDKNDNY